MSSGSRNAIGFVAIICTLCFLANSFDPTFPAGKMFCIGLSALFASISIACFCPRLDSITVRIIGTATLVISSAVIIKNFGNINPIKGLIVLGFLAIQSGYMIVTGAYPSWGLAGEAFRNNRHR